MVPSLYFLHNWIFHSNLDNSWPASFLKALTPFGLFSAFNNLWLILGAQPQTWSAGDPQPQEYVRHHKSLVSLSLRCHSVTHAHTHTHTIPAWALVTFPSRCNGDICLTIPFHGISHPINLVLEGLLLISSIPLCQNPISYPRCHSQSLEFWFTVFSITIKIFNDVLMLRMTRGLLEG